MRLPWFKDQVEKSFDEKIGGLVNHGNLLSYAKQSAADSSTEPKAVFCFDEARELFYQAGGDQQMRF